MLTAVVHSSDVAVLAAWSEGRGVVPVPVPGRIRAFLRFAPTRTREELDEEPDQEPDEEAEAAERAAVIPMMLSWADAAGLTGVDADRLDGVLSRFYTFAEEGLFGLLEEFAVLGRGRGVDGTTRFRSRLRANLWPMGRGRHRRCWRAWPRVTQPRCPTGAGIMFLAAEIDYSGPGWTRS